MREIYPKHWRETVSKHFEENWQLLSQTLAHQSGSCWCFQEVIGLDDKCCSNYYMVRNCHFNREVADSTRKLLVLCAKCSSNYYTRNNIMWNYTVAYKLYTLYLHWINWCWLIELICGEPGDYCWNLFYEYS